MIFNVNIGTFVQKKKEEESPLMGITQDVRKLSVEVLNGMCREMIKASVFNEIHAPPSLK